MKRVTSLKSLTRVLPAALVLPVIWAAPAGAQGTAVPTAAGASASTPFAPVEPCSANETSENLPPPESGPVYRCAQLMFHPAGDRVTETAPMIDAQTYAFYLKGTPSQRSQNKWVPYDEPVLQADFWNLWRTNFLEDLWIEVIDEPYENGVIGKHVVFHMEEKARVKVVDYVPAEEGEDLIVDISKIESTLRDNNVQVRLDSQVDESELRKVISIIRELHAAQGYNDAVVSVEREELPSGPKLLHLTFKIDPGPKVEIAEILFEGNEAFNDGTLRKKLKDNKQKNPWLAFFSDATYKEAKFAEDAERVTEFYKNEGYASAQVGQPQVEVIRTSPDGERRWIRLRVPVDEGQKFTVGTFEITGDKSLNLEAIKALFEIEEGETYSNDKIRKGLDKAKDVYASYGFWEWTFDPQLQPRGIDPATGRPTGEGTPEPIMDITIKMTEGKQFYVNRISFAGNTTTHDSVIRRELRVAEGGVFNAAALRESVRRLNQLGYFKPIEQRPGQPDESTEITRVAGTEDKLDIKMKFEEQNRNQLAFGAGVSQFDGFFGQLSFQTSNFLGRGETVGISLQRGSQARNYQVSFSEPYLFDRPITVGADLYSREYIFPFQYTQASSGSNWVFGFPLADYTRAFVSYAYERVRIKDLNEIYKDPALIRNNPYLADSLLLNQAGNQRTVSKVSPSIIYNTVNQPIFPSDGKRITLGVDFAGLGGNTSYIQTRAESIWYIPLTTRTSLGLRAESQYIRPYGSTTNLPIFEKLFSGGEYTVRGYDLRAISPRDPRSGVLTGGNKMINFNAEYYLNIFGQVRLVGFFDAGQVRDIGDHFGWKENVLQTVTPDIPLLTDLNVLSQGATFLLTEPDAIRTEVVGTRSAFKTSTGFEVRFMMPVLNVPFRLIGAYNPQRGGVLDNQLQPAKRFTFRFAVGTTF